jgi:hypothetical protein
MTASLQPSDRWPTNPYGVPLGTRDPLVALGETPQRYRALAGRFTPDQFRRPYAPGKWNTSEILIHLAQTELAFSMRLRMALTIDGYVVQPFDQDGWMRMEPAVDGPRALDAYEAMRAFNLPLYRSLSVDQLSRRLQHPELGEMRVGWILEGLAGHELHHLPHIEAVAAS